MRTHVLWLLPAALGLGAVLALDRPARTDEPAAPPDGVEVMARGPVHEAYAEPVNARPGPGPVVPKQPPSPIAEEPPDQRPDGDNVRWIPGYWAWDDGSKDFLWVSGFWRDVPPGRQWVPGHWDQADGGWQWSPGFWAAADQDQVEYLPEPPASADSGPSTPAPEEASVYVPGCWVYRETRYLWRPGFWVPFRPGWCWQPAHYVWCPAGYIFVDGYWDRPLEGRGLLFAPVAIDRRAIGNNWTYTPGFVVQPDFLFSALFVRPSWHSYYFGDYFDRGYEDRGFVPWVDYRVGRSAYDPMYAYYRHAFAEDRGWDRGLRELYAGRRAGDIPRPPHTLAQQRQVLNKLTVNKSENETVIKNLNFSQVQNVSVLAPLSQANRLRVTALAGERAAKEAPVLRLQPVPREQRELVRKQAEQFTATAKQRHQAEARLRSEEPGRAERPRTAKLELPRAPEPPREGRQGAKAPPPLPTPPRHEERAPARTEQPPQRGEAPAREPAPRREPAEPPRREATPPEPGREPAARPPEPRREDRTPEPPRREGTPPEPRREAPPREPATRPPEQPRRTETPPAEPRREAPPREPTARPPEQPRGKEAPPRAEPPAPPRKEAPAPGRDKDKQ
jgi:hypothetical protein